jgi:hypothetical protein
MKKIFFSLKIFTGIFLFTLMSCDENPASEELNDPVWLPITEDVNGSLSSIESMRTLKLYGSHYEIGYAHGYLLGPEIFERQKSILSEEGLLVFYENEVLPNINQVHFPNEYYQEIQGNYDGIKARTVDGIIYSELLGREVNYNDAIALNCLNAFASRGMCSSFSVWGDITHNGAVLTAYNHDCSIADEYTGKWIVIVRVPDKASGAIPTVCIGQAGDLNVHTVMNFSGITLSCQAINMFNPATSTDGFASEGIIFRNLIENVHAEQPVEDIENVLNVLYGIEAEALMMSWPNPDQNTCAAALEIDGNLTQNHGFSLRFPDNNKQYIIQTNHFRLRYALPEEPCQRYQDIEACLDSIVSGEKSPLTVESAWQLLRDVRNGGDFLTEIAVIFEPVDKLMHVAFAESGINAHECNRVTLDIGALTDIP